MDFNLLKKPNQYIIITLVSLAYILYGSGNVGIFKRFLPRLIIILVLCVISSVGIITEKTVSVNSDTVVNRQIIILDAGHGGFDGGAVSDDGTVEKNINLNISLKLAQMLKLNGFDVVMTREEDVATDTVDSEKIALRKKSDLENRLLLMEKYPQAVYISVHLNKFTTTAASGAQVFYTKNFEEAARLGLCVQQNIASLLQPTNKRVIKQGTSATYLLHNAKVPAIIVECGFLSNTAELKKLKDTEYQSQMAFAILCGVLKYYETE